MDALRNIKEGIDRAWDSLSGEWSQFMDKASGALARLAPLKKEGEGSVSADLALHAPRFGFMASEMMENDNEVVTRVEAPGMEPGDFQVEVVADRLLIKGRKGVKREERDGRYHVVERA